MISNERLLFPFTFKTIQHIHHYNISFYKISNKLLYNDDFSYKYILYEHHTYFILFTISHQKSLESV